MSANKEDDRRQFFRITDAIGVAYEVVAEASLESDDSAHEEPSQAQQEVVDQGQVDIKTLLEEYGQQVNSALAELSPQQAPMANAIAALNQKIDTLLQFFEWEHLSCRQPFQKVAEASISASGIAFPVDKPIETGATIGLTLYLQPSDEVVKALGRSVGCHDLGDDRHYLRIEFVDISDADRERLIQHIVQRQGSLLRSLREQLETDDG